MNGTQDTKVDTETDIIRTQDTKVDTDTDMSRHVAPTLEFCGSNPGVL